MSMGILGWFHNNVSGDQSRSTPGAGLFDPGSVGSSWADYLKNLYATPTDQTPQYRAQSTALRDALAQETAGTENKFSAASNASGFYDSGARLAGLADINRTHMAAYSQGLSSILAKLESDKMSAAFPFLQAQLGEYNARENAIHNAQGETNWRDAQLGQGISGALGGGAAQSGGGGYGGGSQSAYNAYGSGYGAGTGEG